MQSQDALSGQLIDALANRQSTTYNNLADQYRAANGTVNSLAATETKLRNQLTQATCGNCAADEDAADVPAP
jgi:hypothetical protein